jgi:hypothetical protein
VVVGERTKEAGREGAGRRARLRSGGRREDVCSEMREEEGNGGGFMLEDEGASRATVKGREEPA